MTIQQAEERRRLLLLLPLLPLILLLLLLLLLLLPPLRVHQMLKVARQRRLWNLHHRLPICLQNQQKRLQTNHSSRFVMDRALYFIPFLV